MTTSRCLYYTPFDMTKFVLLDYVIHILVPPFRLILNTNVLLLHIRCMYYRIGIFT